MPKPGGYILFDIPYEPGAPGSGVPGAARSPVRIRHGPPLGRLCPILKGNCPLAEGARGMAVSWMSIDPSTGICCY